LGGQTGQQPAAEEGRDRPRPGRDLVSAICYDRSGNYDWKYVITEDDDRAYENFDKQLQPEQRFF
jgi:hypothetical protein